MTDATSTSTPPRSFLIIGILALAWNLFGVASYLMSVTMSPEAIAAIPETDRVLYQDIPAWVTASFAIAVFGGTLGCVLLLMRRGWAVLVFAVSLLAILLQMTHTLFMTPMLALHGVAGATLPLFIVAVAVYLLWYSNLAKRHGWLK